MNKFQERIGMQHISNLYFKNFQGINAQLQNKIEDVIKNIEEKIRLIKYNRETSLPIINKTIEEFRTLGTEYEEKVIDEIARVKQCSDIFIYHDILNRSSL